MPQSQHSKSVRAFLRVRGLDSCLACSIIKFESVFSHCLLSNPRISCGGVFWWILVRPICLGERGGMWHKGKWWKNNDENSADEFLTKLKSTRFQGTTWHNNPFLYSLRLTLATYHLPFVWFQVVSGRYPGVLLWDWNKSTPQPLFLQATSTTSWASPQADGQNSWTQTPRKSTGGTTVEGPRAVWGVMEVKKEDIFSAWDLISV